MYHAFFQPGARHGGGGRLFTFKTRFKCHRDRVKVIQKEKGWKCLYLLPLTSKWHRSFQNTVIVMCSA
jgi:hypothetical protein